MSKFFSKNNLIYQVFNEYTVLPNNVVESLNYKELGVLCFLASRKAGEQFIKENICKKLSIQIKDLNLILKSFIDKKYIVKEKNNYIFILNGEPITVRKKTTINSTPIKVDDYKDELVVLKELNKHSLVNTKENNKTALKSINRLLSEYNIEDLIGVIKTKHKEWVGTDQEKYIRHQTLFRKSNFEKYYAEFLSEKNKLSKQSKISDMYQKSTEEQKIRLKQNTINLSKEQIKSSQKNVKNIIRELTKNNEKKAK